MHSPDPSDVYLADCEAPLNRELWRVFAIDEATAYTIPRPDAMGLTYGICDGEDADLADVFDRNGLCVDIADPNTVNAMSHVDALAITHALHERLIFQAVPTENDGLSLFPWAPDEDVIDACDQMSAPNTEVQGYCDAIRERNTGGDHNVIGIIPGDDTVLALVDALNTLYGIPQTN